MVNLLFSIRGGVHIGASYIKAWHASWPLAKMEVYEDGIQLLPFPLAKPIFIPRGSVTGIEKWRGPRVSGGVVIKHTETSIPAFILFWCKPESTLQKLAQANYPALNTTKA